MKTRKHPSWTAEKSAALDQVTAAMKATSDDGERRRILAGSTYWAICARQAAGSRVGKGTLNVDDLDDVLQDAVLDLLEGGSTRVDPAVVDGLPAYLTYREVSNLDRRRRHRDFRVDARDRAEVAAAAAQPAPGQTPLEAAVAAHDAIAERNAASRVAEVPLDEWDAATGDGDIVDAASDGIVEALGAVLAESTLRRALQRAVKTWVAANGRAGEEIAVLDSIDAAADRLGGLTNWLAFGEVTGDLRDLIGQQIAQSMERAVGQTEVGAPTAVRLTLLAAARVWRMPTPGWVALLTSSRDGRNMWTALAAGELDEDVADLLLRPYRDLDEAKLATRIRTLSRMGRPAAWTAWCRAAGLPAVGQTAPDGQDDLFADQVA